MKDKEARKKFFQAAGTFVDGGSEFRDLQRGTDVLVVRGRLQGSDWYAR